MKIKSKIANLRFLPLIAIGVCLFQSIPAAFAIELSALEKSYLKEKGTIVLVSQTQYPPFEFVGPDGDHTGMCIELVRWISTEFGFKVHFTDTPFNKAQEDVLTGEADILTSLFYSKKRDKLFDFTKVMFDVPASIFVVAQRPDIKGTHDLQGKTVAMQAGDYAEDFLAEQNIECTIRYTSNFAEATDLVIAGEADVLIGDEQIVLYHIFSNNLTKQIKKVGEPLYIGQNCMGAKDPNPILIGIFNKGIDKAISAGVLDQINQKWIGIQYASGSSWLQRNYPYIYVFTGCIFLLTILAWFWNYKLRQMVAHRTAELSKSENTLRTVLTTSPLGIGLTEGRVLGWHNQAMSQMLGYGPGELEGQDIQVLYPDKRHASSVGKKLKLALKEARYATLETQWVRKDRGLFDCRIVYAPLKLGDHKSTAIAIAEDISSQKRSEKALHTQWNLAVDLSSISGMSEALNKILAANMNIEGVDCGGIYLVEEITGTLNLIAHRGVSSAFVKAASHYEENSKQVALARAGESIYGNYSEISQSKDAAMHSEGLRAVAIIPVLYKGGLVAVLNLASKTRDHFSRTTRKVIEALAAQTGGVIARVKAEERERQSQELIRILFDTIDDFLFILDNQGRIIRFNPVVEKRLGYSAAELKGMNVTDVHPPERREEAMTIVMEMLAGNATHCPVPLCTKAGDLIPVETKVARGMWAGQEVLFGISRDITERLKAEAAWRSSEDRLRTAINAIDEGFAIFDPDDRLAMCNAKYREIYRESADLIQDGVKFEELVRKGIERGQYPEAEGRQEEWFAERMALHRAADSSMQQVLKNGRWVKVNERKTKDGSTVGFRVDITGLKQTEMRLQAALKEKDALLREIHHRVKNNMAVVSSLINLQAKRMGNPKVKVALKESQSRIQSMALVHEHLYQSKNMARINLQDYFQQLANSVAGVYQGARGKIAMNIDARGITLPIDQAVPCGIILNELITNAIKYGFPDGREGKVDIFARQTAEGKLELSVRDNGIGLSEDSDLESSKSLGLRLIGLMTDQLHGTMQITSEGGVGTTIRWPVDGKGINQ